MTFYNGQESYIQDPEILKVLECARVLGLSDARDRIYAFSALPYLRQPLPTLSPNYRTPPEDVFREFAVEYLNGFSDLNTLLNFIHTQETLDNPQNTSWVPFWDRRGWVGRFSLRNQY